MPSLMSWSPPEMKIFSPLIRHVSPSRTAFVRIAARSEPAPGSVSAMVESQRPSAIGGMSSAFCASVPNLSSTLTAPGTSEVTIWSAWFAPEKISLTPARIAALRAWPPNASGIESPCQPCPASSA